MSGRQFGAFTGILFVALLAACIIVGGETPDSTDSAQKVVSFYTDHDTRQFISAILGALAVAAFLFYLGPLRARLRAAPGDDGRLSTVVMLGAFMFAVGGALLSASTFALADTADDLNPIAVQAINGLGQDLFAPALIGSIVFNLGFALAVLRHGAFPKWMAWVGIIGVIANFTPAWFLPFIAVGVIVVGSSIVMMRDPDATAVGAPAAT